MLLLLGVGEIPGCENLNKLSCNILRFIIKNLGYSSFIQSVSVQAQYLRVSI
jgi:hypothetical protein